MGEERIIPRPPLARRREADILEELPNPAGMVLWQDVRHLRDWAESTPEIRAKLFHPPSSKVLAKRKSACACVAELTGPLETFGAMTAYPLNADPAELGAACEQIVEWALEREHTQTA